MTRPDVPDAEASTPAHGRPESLSDLLGGWVWVGQYILRVSVFGPLYAADAVVALGVARAVLSWPLVAACVGVSAIVLRWVLPRDHPGFRHPRPAAP